MPCWKLSDKQGHSGTAFKHVGLNLRFYGDKTPFEVSYPSVRRNFVATGLDELILPPDGTNRYPPHQLSLMTIERANGSGNRFFTGVILTRSGTNLMNSRMCLMYVDGEKTGRQMINTSKGQRNRCIQESFQATQPIAKSDHDRWLNHPHRLPLPAAEPD